MKPVSVLIPSRTDAYLETLFTSMESSEPGSVAACIVGDNGLSEDFRSRWSQAKYVQVPRPFVFSKAVNLCAGKAKAEADLLVLNDDTEIVTPFWYTMLQNRLDAGVGNYGVLSLRIQGGVGNEDQYADIPPDGLMSSNKVICFVCAVIPCHIWAQVGPLDERFTGYGMDDSDYCRRVMDAGYRLGVLGCVLVKHGDKFLPGTLRGKAFIPDESLGRETGIKVNHSSSFIKYLGTDEWERQYALNLRLFQEKWGLKSAKQAMPVAPAREEGQPSKPGLEARKLNLGCGSKALPGWVNLDVRPLPGVNVVRDLRRGLPFEDASFDHILADNVLEHFVNDDFIFILNEMDRVLKVGGTCEIIVPSAGSQGSIQDPTHKMFFVPRSSLYWNQVQTPNGGKAVGITANLVPYKEVEMFGDPATEHFMRFRLRKEPLK